MQEQTTRDHRRYVPGFHFVLSLIMFLSLIGSIINLVKSFDNHEVLYSASLTLCRLDRCPLSFRLHARFRAPRRKIARSVPRRTSAISSSTGKLLDSRLTAQASHWPSVRIGW